MSGGVETSAEPKSDGNRSVWPTWEKCVCGKWCGKFCDRGGTEAPAGGGSGRERNFCTAGRLLVTLISLALGVFTLKPSGTMGYLLLATAPTPCKTEVEEHSGRGVTFSLPPGSETELGDVGNGVEDEMRAVGADDAGGVGDEDENRRPSEGQSTTSR
jgi:hypothetical protein